MLTRINEVMKKMRSVGKNEKGATMVEYALMVALIAAVAMGIVTTLGTNTEAKFKAVSDKLAPAAN